MNETNPPPIETKQLDLWPEDENRIDTIGQNGNDGLHYKDVKRILLREYVSPDDVLEWLATEEDLHFWYAPFAKEYNLTVITPIHRDEYTGTSYFDCVRQAVVEERIINERKKS
jgi:hypothetical protein